MTRAIYLGTDYASVRYVDTDKVWLLRDEDGRVTVARDVEVADMEVECDRCGEFNAYIYPLERWGRRLCSDCEEAVTHGD
jgi:hypothetical protein